LFLVFIQRNARQNPAVRNSSPTFRVNKHEVVFITYQREEHKTGGIILVKAFTGTAGIAHCSATCFHSTAPS
jgi:hypothetical protein